MPLLVNYSATCYQTCITAGDGTIRLDRDGKCLNLSCIICRAGNGDIIAVLDIEQRLDYLLAIICQVIQAGIGFRIQFCLVSFCF